MPLDDELRDQLQRERNQLGAVSRPTEVLDGLRPDMVRARRFRRLTHVGAAGLLVAGGFVVAQIGTGSDQGSLEIVPAYQPGEEVPVTPAPPISSDSNSPARPPSSAEDADDDDAIADVSIGARAVEAGNEPSAAASDVSDDPSPDDDDAGTTAPQPSSSAVSTSSIAETGAPPTSTVNDGMGGDSHDGEDDGSHDGTGDGNHDGSVEHATSTTPEAEATEPTRFDSRCGSVIADVSGSHPQIIEILPQPGYAAVVEDEDHGSVTVHLEGGGEDCEVKVS